MILSSCIFRILVYNSSIHKEIEMKVFYNKNQTAKTNDSFSPSATKPKLVLAEWKKRFKIEVVDFAPMTRCDLYEAHNEEYIDGLLDLKISNGFGNHLPAIADSIPYTTGSFVAASLHAFETGEITASPTSGFHHACYSSGGGFCSVNGLMVAAVKLIQAGANEVGIIDLDEHYGNGTDSIRRELELESKIPHYTLGHEDVNRNNADDWLDALPYILKSKFSEVDVILYQAGADPHIDDPLGGRLTTEQMRRRDRIVFEVASELGVGVAFNLAGGYQNPVEKVVQLHINTMEEAIIVEASRNILDILEGEYHEEKFNLSS